ncbi:MAG: ribonuclease H family protein [Anaerolineaceae bacterium]|nr:ribonuclease H family protein [Anaerolineaceae bacterium]
MPKQKYYVVWKGRETGVFNTWEECSAQVIGFKDAQFKSFENRETAEIALGKTFEEYKGKRVSPLSAANLALRGKPIANSYCVDASCIGNPGLMEYRCIHTATKKLLFQQGPFENGTNNIGEFLAIVHALALFKKRKFSECVYTDSDTAMKWVKSKKCKSKLPPDDKNNKIFELILRAEEWLQKNEYTTKIIKWDTEAWGEIPADFGRK